MPCLTALSTPHCSNTVAAAGVQNLVFAKYYREGSHMYDILGRIPNMNIITIQYSGTIDNTCTVKYIQVSDSDTEQISSGKDKKYHLPKI